MQQPGEGSALHYELYLEWARRLHTLTQPSRIEGEGLSVSYRMCRRNLNLHGEGSVCKTGGKGFDSLL